MKRQVWKRFLAGALMASALVSGPAVAKTDPGPKPPTKSDANCNTGQYNYRQLTQGACAWGNINVSKGKMTVKATVMDNAADGRCAKLEVQSYEYLLRVPDEWEEIDKAISCGNGKTRVFEKTYEVRFEDRDAYRFRVCSLNGGHCTSWDEHDFKK